MITHCSRAADTQRLAADDVWRINLPCGPLLTANQRMHHMAKARLTRQLRGEATLLARAARIPQLDQIHIDGLVIPPDKRRRDPSNWFPSFKAAIDGLVDAGVITDDAADYLIGPDMRLADVVRCECRRVHIALEIWAAGYGDPTGDGDE